MNTYQAVIDEIKGTHGRTMKPCWIADRKEKNGVVLKSRRTTPRKITCPPRWQAVIDNVLRKLGLIE